jgi:hypothetical protein
VKIEGKQRTKLDEALRDATTTIVIFCGPGATASACHDAAEENRSQPWHRVFWLPKHRPLTAEEREEWELCEPGASGGPAPADPAATFALLSGGPKKLVDSGTVDELLKPNGEPSARRMLDLFDVGDAQ